MPVSATLRRLAVAASLCLAAAGAHAQRTDGSTEPYVPSVGQPGKDVVWVPTPDLLVSRMLDLATVGPRDVVLDLGSGDGRTVVAAAKRGATAMGIELNPDLVGLARQRAQREGVADRARFEQQDLFETDLSRATVITMFLLNEINLKLRPKLLQLAPGTRIVSNTFRMGEWEPDQTVTLPPSVCVDAWCTAHFWLVPARVAGTHSVDGGQLVLEQRFQMLTGTLRSGGTTVPVEGRVRGDEVEVKAGGRTLRGTAGSGGIAWK
ncbi:MAG: methyltransferase domain-containing protein [Burkholderiales bacterium]|jgi:SAM-dependent methyltransferase